MITIEISTDGIKELHKDIVIRLNLADLISNPNTVQPQSRKQPAYLFPFMQKVIETQQGQGKIRTAETYKSAMSSFRRYMNGQDVLLDEMDKDLMVGYETWLRSEGISRNTSSFYLRKLRAVYNRAVEAGLTTDRQPFKCVYTGMGRTNKRAVGVDIIRRFKAYQPVSKAERMAQALFMFSFYTRGMSFIDMAQLKKTDLTDGFLTYTRKKTGQQLVVKWEKELQDIVSLLTSDDSGPYLLPIIRRSNTSERGQYRGMQLRVNMGLRSISDHLNLERKLTMYVARHSWASIARAMGIPVSVISQAMGHTSEKTTQIYLKTIDKSVIDEANTTVIAGVNS